VSVDGGVGGGDGCSGGAAESGGPGPGPDPRAGSYVCVVGGGEGLVGERSTGHERGRKRKRKRKEDRAPRHAVTAVMRCHLLDIELSELGTVVGDGDDRLVGQVAAPPHRLFGQVPAEPARVSGRRGRRR